MLSKKSHSILFFFATRNHITNARWVYVFWFNYDMGNFLCSLNNTTRFIFIFSKLLKKIIIAFENLFTFHFFYHFCNFGVPHILYLVRSRVDDVKSKYRMLLHPVAAATTTIAAAYDSLTSDVIQNRISVIRNNI